MSENKFTPGPWYAWDNGDGMIGVGKLYGDQSDLFRAVGASLRPLAEDNHNMRIAAAAPDLLEALNELLPAFMSKSAMMDKNDWSAVNKANAAIAKARGEA
jgi:hypothetical protein